MGSAVYLVGLVGVGDLRGRPCLYPQLTFAGSISVRILRSGLGPQRHRSDHLLHQRRTATVAMGWLRRTAAVAAIGNSSKSTGLERASVRTPPPWSAHGRTFLRIETSSDGSEFSISVTSRRSRVFRKRFRYLRPRDRLIAGRRPSRRDLLHEPQKDSSH